MYALLSRERSNDPCYVAIGTENVNSATSDAAPELDLCGSGGPSSSTLHADYLDTNAGGVGDHIFVTGVIVGMNQDGDEVKGIGVIGSQLMANGSLVPVSGSVWGYRANFDSWENWAFCAAGKIATAVDFHFAAGNAPRRLTGISLQCRTVTPL